MKVVIQRVSEASVKVDGAIVGAIQAGLLVLLGIHNEDTLEDVQWISNKLVQMRIFDDADGVMNLSVKEVHGDILLISQFTLHASTKKGNRPSYIRAAKPEIAVPLYENFKKTLESYSGKSIQSGKFGANMKVTLINDGPVTIIMDTKNKE